MGLAVLGQSDAALGWRRGGCRVPVLNRRDGSGRPGNSRTAPLFLSFPSILKRGRRSDFLRWRPRLISSADGGIGPNLQKTKDVIGAQVRGASHKLGPAWRSFAGEADFTHFFFGNAKLFSRERGYIGRPTHDRLAALRQGSRTFPERGTWEAGRPGPPLLLFPLQKSPISLAFTSEILRFAQDDRSTDRSVGATL